MTRKTLRAKSQAFGNALRTTWNWQKGDVLAIFGPNDVDWGTAVFGTAWAGGVVTTISFTLTAEELAYQLRNSSTKAILVHELGLKTVQQAARLAGLPQHRILLFGKERNDVSIIDSERSSNYKHFLQLQSSGPAPSRYAVDPKNDVVLLVYSSGTTGFPKGVRLTHYNMVAQCAQIAASEIDGSKPGYDTKLLAFLPLAHIYCN